MRRRAAFVILALTAWTLGSALGAIAPGSSDASAGAPIRLSAAHAGYTPDLTGVGSYTGPIQAMTYIVPGTSSQKVISAEAANAVYGHGGVPNDEASSRGGRASQRCRLDIVRGDSDEGNDRTARARSVRGRGRGKGK